MNWQSVGLCRQVVMGMVCWVSMWGISQAGAGDNDFRAAYELRKAGQYEQAVAKFEKGLRVDPRNPTAHLFLGESYLLLMQPEKARKAFEQVLRIQSQGSDADKARSYLSEMNQPASHAQSRTPGSEFKDCQECPAMVVIPPGLFTMGSPTEEVGRSGDEGPVHQVTVPHALAVGKYEVTFDEWAACVRDKVCVQPNDSGMGQGRRPVININWNEATEYAEWLSAKTGQKYRLLSEAEWEYAARAGSDQARHYGTSDKLLCQFARNNEACSAQGFSGTAPVGSFKPNAFGLYDMLGNVWEWVADCWHPNYDGAPSEAGVWTGGNCSQRVNRGGSWGNSARSVRSASRNFDTSANRFSNLGIRLARTLP